MVPRGSVARRRRARDTACTAHCVATVVLACAVAVVSIAVLLDLAPAARPPSPGAAVPHTVQPRWAVPAGTPHTPDPALAATPRARGGHGGPRVLASGRALHGTGGGARIGATGVGTGDGRVRRPSVARSRRRRRVPADVAFALGAASRASAPPRYTKAGGIGRVTSRALAQTPLFASQLSALQAMYTGLGGEFWGHTGNWTSTTDYCSFYGIKCDHHGNVVTMYVLRATALHHSCAMVVDRRRATHCVACATAV